MTIECILYSGNVDYTIPRSWVLNGVTLISDGNLSTAGSGYKEIAGSDKFSLSTPMLDYSFDAAIFQCNYGFSQATLNVKIYGKFHSINMKSIFELFYNYIFIQFIESIN